MSELGLVSTETTAVVGVVGALVLALVLWKLLKLTVKIVIFVVAGAVIAGVVALYVAGQGARLGVDGAPGRPGGSPPAVPVPAAPR